MAKPVPIPDHELVRLIGRGSYGQVWLARNAMGHWRAVKVVFRESFRDARPFERELSGIRRFEPISRSHEGFVDVLHAGLNEEQGYFYYVMEVGDDQSLGQAINPQTYSPKTLASEISKQGRLSLAECLRWALQISHALAELHKHGLTHRDIKPSNIIFVEGTPKLADIGLVADMDETRSFVGTEGFMPPEGPGSAQADIYSLGKVLYEASTGNDRLEYPSLPGDWSSSPEYGGLLELNEVIVRACEQVSQRRFASAWDLHADLLLVLNGKSVRKLRMLERRLKSLKHLAGVGALILVAAGAIFYQFYREWRVADDFRRRQVSDYLSHGNRAMDAGDSLGATPYFAEALRLDHGDVDGEMSHRLRLGSTLADCPKPVQVWLTETPVQCGEISRDGRKVLLVGYYGKAQVRDLKTGRVLASPFGPKYGLRSAAFSPDGRLVVTASEDHSVILWDAQTSSPVRELPHPDKVVSARFSPDASQVVTASFDGWAYLWDVATGRKVSALGPYPGGASFADFSRDGKLVAVTSFGGLTEVWQTAPLQRLPRRFEHNTWVVYASFNPDGSQLVVACADHIARVWDLTSGRRVSPDLRHDDMVRSAEFSPDGRYILTSGNDGTARIWRAEDLQPAASNPILRHGERVNHASFDASGRLVLTTCQDGSARVWDLASSILRPEPLAGSLCATAERSLIFTNQELQVCGTSSGKVVNTPIRPKALLKLAQLSTDGGSVLSVCALKSGPTETNDLVRVWNVGSGAEVGREIRVAGAVAGATLSADSRRVATWMGGVAQIWDVNQGRALTPALNHRRNIGSAVFSPDGNHLAAVCGGDVYVWSAVGGRSNYYRLEHTAPVAHVEFSRDGRYLATCCADASLNKCSARVWAVPTGQPASPPLNHADGVLFASFSPDGRRIVTASEDFTARIWQTATGRPTGLPLKHGHQVTAARFSSDGRWVVTACRDGTARVWDAENNAPLTPPLRHLSALVQAAFLPRLRRFERLSRTVTEMR